MSDNLLLQYLKDIKDGQDDLSDRVKNIEISLAVKEGEKRIKNRMVIAASGIVSILTSALINYFADHTHN